MDLLQTVCRKGARRSLVALSLSPLRTTPTTSRSPFSTSRVLLSDQPPRPPPAPAQSEGIIRLRNTLKKSADARNLSGDSLFGSGGGGRGPLRTGATLDHLHELITKDANQSLQPFSQDEFFNKHIHRTELEASLRLRPVTGRTVNVRHGGVSDALKELGRKCMQNKVRNDEIRQRFHERPALKRKRKLRERWRARFKEGVNAAISRTMTLRAQGW
jgi:small subunit ribosomal protein MRP21